MKSIHLYVFAFLLFPFLAAAQSNYKPGYVVTPKGDTIKGFIDYRDWDASPNSISFKTNLADRDKQSYTMANASGFGVYGLATYQKYLVSISMDVTNTLHLVEGRDTSFRIDTVFLRVLQKGKNLALYQYTDYFKTRFYISEAPVYTPTELVFRLYYSLSVKENERTINENTYLRQLCALALKYKVLDDKLTNMIESADYEKTDLLKIVSRVNHVSKADYEKKYSDKSLVRLYVSAGAASVTTSPTAGSDYALDGGGKSNSVLPFFAVGADLVPDPNSRAEFKLDVSINPARYNNTFKLTVSPYNEQNASYDQLGFFLAPQAMYNFYNAENFKFYVGAGLMVSYNTYKNASFEAVGGGQSISGGDFFFNRFGDGYLLKAGVKIGRNIELFYTYYGATAATRQGFFSLNSQPSEFGLSYIFGK